MQSRALTARALPALSDSTRAALGDAMLWFWLSRLLVWGAGIAGVLAIGLWPGHAAFDPAGITMPFGATGDVLVGPFARWDTVWFLAIADGGYGSEAARQAFFPLYPLVARIAGAPLGSTLVGGILASNALFAAALVLLHKLTALDFGRAVARNAVRVTALFPMAFFFSAFYSESLFLALSIGAIYAARRDRWAWAGALGAGAAATRSAGLFLLVPLAMIYLWDTRRPSLRGARRLDRDALWLALVPLGLASFCAFLALNGQDALGPFHAQAVWLRSFAGPFGGVWDGAVGAWQGARQLLSGSRTHIYFTAAGGDPFQVARHNLEMFGWLLLAIPAVIGVLRRLPAAYGAYVLVALALPLSYPVGPEPLMSLPRFIAVLFPLAIWLAAWMTGRVWRERIVLGAFTIGLAVYSAWFATWHWVA